MTNATNELKVRAEILHGRMQAGDPAALARLRILPEFRGLPAPEIQLRHCLAVIAAELGFSSWLHAKQVVGGEDHTNDFGTLLYPKRCGGHLNRWYKTYEEAAEMRKDCDGYLLAYRRQYFVVDRYFIESLGLDPDDSDWTAMGFDWVSPRDTAARARLYAKLVAALAREALVTEPRP